VDIEALKKSPCGRLVPVSGVDMRTGERWDHYAFIPTPLPDVPQLGYPALDAATKAAMAIAALGMAASQLPNPALLVRPAIRREAVSTSALEGTFATYEETLEADFVADQRLSLEMREVRNYITATERALELLKKYPICRTVLSELQAIIVRGTRDDSPEAGDLRKKQVAIGAERRPVAEARFIPTPPGHELVEGVSDWEKWVNAENHVPIIAKIAMAHYQFETLHPYHNGNGRLGRLVAILQLVASGALNLPIVNIAPYLDDHQDQYRDHLLTISHTGNFDDWIIFFSRAVETQANEAITAIEALNSFRKRTIEKLRNDGIRGAALDLVEFLVGYPVFDVPTARDYLGKTFETANQAVAKLVDRGVLMEVTGQRKNRIFICPEVRHITSLHLPKRSL
jgi:Fic family protein